MMQITRRLMFGMAASALLAAAVVAPAHAAGKIHIAFGDIAACGGPDPTGLVAAHALSMPPDAHRPEATQSKFASPCKSRE